MRLRARLDAGTPLVLLEKAYGIVLLTRDPVRARVRDQLTGTELVAQLLAERRHASVVEDLG